MSRLLVEVYLPAAGQAYDVFLPAEQRVSSLAPLVTRALASLSGGRFADAAGAVLCDRETGAVLDINMTVHELGLSSGARLMLI